MVQARMNYNPGAGNPSPQQLAQQLQRPNMAGVNGRPTGPFIYGASKRPMPGTTGPQPGQPQTLTPQQTQQFMQSPIGQQMMSRLPQSYQQAVQQYMPPTPGATPTPPVTPPPAASPPVPATSMPQWRQQMMQQWQNMPRGPMFGGAFAGMPTSWTA